MKRLIIAVLIIALSVFNGFTGEIFTNDYKENVFKHADTLSKMGVMQAGSELEKKASLYIIKNFKKAGLDTSKETFEFETYRIDKIILSVNSKPLAVEFIGINPYDSKKHFEGQAVLYNLKDDIAPNKISGQTVIVPGPAKIPDFFRLMYFGAKVVCFVPSDSFEKAVAENNTSYSLTIKGEKRTLQSANVIGTLYAKNKTDKEIWITAHYDSYKTSPGANDNGTGIGSLIELSKIFKKEQNRLTCNLKFIAFGGEEVGLLGSRIYLKEHKNDLSNCQLVFNIDTVGGKGMICVETEGGVVEKYTTVGENHFPEYLTNKTWEDLDGKWRIMHSEILPPIIEASHIPEWLKTSIAKSAKKASIQYKPSKGLFSDLRVFAQSGISCTGVAQKTGSPILHTPNDTSEKINKKQLEEAGILCHSVIMETMKRF